MADADADRQKRGISRLGPAAPGAAVRIGVGMSAVEELDQNDVESRAFSRRARQSADLHDASNLDLEGRRWAMNIGGAG